MTDRAVVRSAYDAVAGPRMRALAEATGFQVLDLLVRDPYRNVEYASRRCYLILRAP